LQYRWIDKVLQKYKINKNKLNKNRKGREVSWSFLPKCRKKSEKKLFPKEII